MGDGEGPSQLARGRIELAHSARHIQPGELMVLDQRGREVSRLKLRGRNFLFGALFGLAVTVPLTALGAGALATSVVGGVLFGGWWWRYQRTWRPLLVAQSRLTAGDIAGAEAILARLPPPRSPRQAQQRAWLLGFIAYARAQDADAIRQFERCLALDPGHAFRRLALQSALVELHARTGDLTEAKALRAGIAVRADLADVAVLTLAGADLAIAIVEDTAAALAQDQLDRWTRLALELNQTSHTLAMLARVVAARGDDELADHLAHEARDRFCWCPLEAWPELAAWVDARLASRPISEG